MTTREETAEKVFEVTDVQLSILESNPRQIEVIASGNASTPGWKDAHLSPVHYVMPPADGIQDFSFLATPPEDIVPDVVTPISAKYRIEQEPEWLKGVRIHAATNSMVAYLDAAAGAGG